MACSCTQNKTVRPVETCIFCGNKHITTAVAIRPADPMSITNSYVIGQIACAAKHYNTNFPEMNAKCVALIDRIYSREDYSKELDELHSSAWQLVLENQKNKTEYLYRAVVDPLPDSADYRAACMRLATAKALYELEIGYQSVNKSYAMGELIAAAWHLQRLDRMLAFRCRNIWLKIEKLQECNKELDSLIETVWERC